MVWCQIGSWPDACLFFFFALKDVKGPQQLVKPIVLPSLSSSSIFSFFFFSSTNIPCLYISPKSTSALLIEEERTLGSLIPFFILGTVFLWPLFCALNIQVDFSREIPATIEIFEVGRLVAAATKSLQLCPTLCDPIDSSPQGYRIPGILQERTLEWVAISFSNEWKGSRSVVSDSLRPHGLQPTRLLHPWDSPGKNTGVGCHHRARISQFCNS